MGGGGQDNGSVATTEFSVRTEDLTGFVDRGTSHVAHLTSLFDQLAATRSRAMGTLAGAEVPIPLTAKVGSLTGADPLADLIAATTSTNVFVREIRDSLEAFDGSGAVTVAPFDRSLLAGVDEETRAAFTVAWYFSEIFGGDKVSGDLGGRFGDLADPSVADDVEQRLRDAGYRGAQLDDALADIARAGRFYAKPANGERLDALDDANDNKPDQDQKLSAEDAWLRTFAITAAVEVAEASAIRRLAIGGWTMAQDLNPGDLQEVFDGRSKLGPLDGLERATMVDAFVVGKVNDVLDTDKPIFAPGDRTVGQLISLGHGDYSPELLADLRQATIARAVELEVNAGEGQNPQFVASVLAVAGLSLLDRDPSSSIDDLMPADAAVVAAALNLDEVFPDIAFPEYLDLRTEVAADVLRSLADAAGPGGRLSPSGTGFVDMALATAPVRSYWSFAPTAFAAEIGRAAAIATFPDDASAQRFHEGRLVGLFESPDALALLASDPHEIDGATRAQLLHTAMVGRPVSAGSGSVEYWTADDFADGARSVAVDVTVDAARIYHETVFGLPLRIVDEARLRAVAATDQGQDLVGFNADTSYWFRAQFVAMVVDNDWSAQDFAGDGSGWVNPTVNGEYLVRLAARTDPSLTVAELDAIRAIGGSSAGQRYLGLDTSIGDQERQLYVHHIVEAGWTVATFEAADPIHNDSINNAIAKAAFARYGPDSPLGLELAAIAPGGTDYPERYVRAALGLGAGGGDDVVDRITGEIGTIDPGSSIGLVPIHLRTDRQNIDLMLFEVVRGGRTLYVDLNGKHYSDPADWYASNELPPARVTYAGIKGDQPSGSRFVVPGTGDGYDLVYRLTENYPDTFSERYLDWIVTGVVIVGGVLMIVGSGGLATPVVGASGAALLGTTGSVLVGGAAAHQVVDGGRQLYDHVGHGGDWTDPVAVDAYLTLGDGLLSAVSVGSSSLASRGVRLSPGLASSLTYANRGAAVVETGLNAQQVWQIIESDLSADEKRRQLAVLGVLGAVEFGIPLAANRVIAANTRTAATAQEARRLNAELTADDIAYGMSLGATTPEQLAALPRVRHEAQAQLAMAADAQVEIDALARNLADQYGGTVFGTPKGLDRTIQKVLLDDDLTSPSELKDLARNTIVVADQASLDAVRGKLRDLDRFIGGGNEETGFKGVNAKVSTSSGMMAEVQANTPDMIYAGFDEATARQILGDGLYDYLDAGIEATGGRGHALYEQVRVLPEGSEPRAVLAAEARAYHGTIRDQYLALDQATVRELLASAVER